MANIVAVWSIAWIVTLPFAAVLGMAAFLIVRRLCAVDNMFHLYESNWFFRAVDSLAFEVFDFGASWRHASSKLQRRKDGRGRGRA
jgi:hypothetical protein